jgi:hypothetical protein
LKKYLELPNGIPSADTILRVIAGIDGKELERAQKAALCSRAAKTLPT